MDVTYAVTLDDFLELQKFNHRRQPKNPLVHPATITLIMIIGWAILFHSLVRGVIYGCLGGLFAFFLMPLQRKQRAKAWAAKNPAYFGETTLSISPEGFRFKNSAEDSSARWTAVRDIVENKPCLYLFFGGSGALVIPERAFKSPDEARRFLDLANSYWKSAKPSPESKKPE